MNTAPWPVRIRVVVAPSIAPGEQVVTTLVADRASSVLLTAHLRALPDPAPDCEDAHETTAAATSTQVLDPATARAVTLLVCSRCRWAGTTAGEEAEGDPVEYLAPEGADVLAVATAARHADDRDRADALEALAAEPPTADPPPDPTVPALPPPDPATIPDGDRVNAPTPAVLLAGQATTEADAAPDPARVADAPAPDPR